MPGPPPNPDAIRRNARPDFVKLPAEGRKGKAPKWPLGAPIPHNSSDLAEVVLADRAAREREIWAEVWATPQAVQWERMRAVRTVARYVRVLALAELLPEKETLTEARLLEVQLGVTPAAMKSLGWMVVEDEVGAARAAAAEATAGKAAKARRMSAVK